MIRYETVFAVIGNKEAYSVQRRMGLSFWVLGSTGASWREAVGTVKLAFLSLNITPSTGLREPGTKFCLGDWAIRL